MHSWPSFKRRLFFLSKCSLTLKCSTIPIEIKILDLNQQKHMFNSPKVLEPCKYSNNLNTNTWIPDSSEYTVWVSGIQMVTSYDLEDHSNTGHFRPRSGFFQFSFQIPFWIPEPFTTGHKFTEKVAWYFCLHCVALCSVVHRLPDIYYMLWNGLTF